MIDPSNAPWDPQFSDGKGGPSRRPSDLPSAGPGLVSLSFRPIMANYQYIYTMLNLRKVVPPSREILKGIYLSFYPDAKIGVLGSNGAGKSSLLRIMAGV